MGEADARVGFVLCERALGPETVRPEIHAIGQRAIHAEQCPVSLKGTVVACMPVLRDEAAGLCLGRVIVPNLDSAGARVFVPGEDAMRDVDIVAVREGTNGDRDFLAQKEVARIMPDIDGEMAIRKSEVSAVERARDRRLQRLPVIEPA